jgi:phage gp36-like protein
VPYIAQADFVPARMSQQELVELTDDGGTGEVDTTVLDGVIARAGGVIDAHAIRYTLPLTASDQVKNLALDLAEFYLYERRRRVPAAVQAKYDNAMSLLRRVADGKAGLDQPAKQQSSNLSVATPDHDDADEQDAFDKKKLEAF